MLAFLKRTNARVLDIAMKIGVPVATGMMSYAACRVRCTRAMSPALHDKLATGALGSGFLAGGSRHNDPA